MCTGVVAKKTSSDHFATQTLVLDWLRTSTILDPNFDLIVSNVTERLI